MTMPMHVADLTEDGLALCGERYMGMEVYAYHEPSDYGGSFSTHWSTPSKHKEVVRLFTEHQLEEKIVLLESILILACGHVKSKAYDDNGDNIALSVIVDMVEEGLRLEIWEEGVLEEND